MITHWFPQDGAILATYTHRVSSYWIRERDKRTVPLHWPLLAVAVFPPFTVTVPYDRGKVRAMRRVLRRQ